MTSAFERPCKTCGEHVFLSSPHIVIRHTVGLGQDYLCWECWIDICNSAMLGYNMRAEVGGVT